MKNPTLFDQADDLPAKQNNIFELFGRHEKEIVNFLEQEYGELSGDEKLAVILTSCYVQAGHVCMPISKPADELARLIDLDDDITENLENRKLVLDNSSITGGPSQKTPMILNGGLLYFRRYFIDELRLKSWISEKSPHQQVKAIRDEDRIILDELFEKTSSDNEINWQKVAAALSLIKPFLIVSGGPGTGKTTTVARILALQQRRVEESLKIALAAPTGKAAGRMGEALFSELQSLDLTADQIRGFPEEAQTIHRLLRGVEHRGLLPPARQKYLDYDIVIVDEASMIDLTLMNRLIDHIAEGTQLILLGDKDQLASVEAGSVFSDLCRNSGNMFSAETAAKLSKLAIEIPGDEDSTQNGNDSIVYLTKSYRFDENSGIGTLAGAVKAGINDKNRLVAMFSKFSDIEHHPFDYSKTDFDRMTSVLRDRVKHSASITDAAEMLEFWKSSIWLTVLRRSLSGSDRLNQLAEQSLAASGTVLMKQGWYHGRPVIITRNDYSLGIFNGDHGVCMKGEGDELRVYIHTGADIKTIRPEHLIHYNPSYFLTVHKSQGSEFDRVKLLMPIKQTPILTKEILYTAITRARDTFYLYGDLGLFMKGSENRTVRYSGF